MSVSPKRTFELLVEVNNRCAELGLSDDDRLDLFELAWLMTASNLRNATLAIPGGFPTEQSRQLRILEHMVEMVRTDEPDLEAERLFQEGDIEGLHQHFHKMLGQLNEKRGTE